MGFSLETPRAILRPWERGASDLAGFRALATDPDVVRYITRGVPLPEEKSQEFLERQLRFYDERQFCLWKLTVKGREGINGFCGIQPFLHSDEVEIGWWLAKEFWGQGLATEAAREVLRDGFERVGLSRIIAAAMPENAASIAIMGKLGMTYVREDTHREIGRASCRERV